MSEKDLVWRQVSPDHWQRDVDECEHLYSVIWKYLEHTGRVNLAITGHISISIRLPNDENNTSMARRLENAIRKAWSVLRYDHPTLGAWIEFDRATGRFNKQYQTLKTVGDLDAWNASTCQLVSSGVTGQDWCNSDPPCPKTPSIFLVEPPIDRRDTEVLRRDLVFRSHHHTIDGIGALTLLNNLLTYTAQILQGHDLPTPTFGGDEMKNMSPPLHVAAGLPNSLTSEQQQLFDEIVASNQILHEKRPALVFPLRHEATTPGEFKRTVIQLSQAETTQLLSACKRAGVSVTAAFHTAIILCLVPLQKRTSIEQAMRYSMIGLVNFRNKCKEPYNTSKHPVALYHGFTLNRLSVDVTIPAEHDTVPLAPDSARTKADFAIAVRTVNNFYNATLRDPNLLPFAGPNLNTWCPKYPPDPLPEGKPRTFTPSVTISSLGVIDRLIPQTHGPIEVYNPWVAGDQLVNGLGYFLNTYRGELHLALTWNNAWHTEEEIVKLLETVHEIARAGLGVGETD